MKEENDIESLLIRYILKEATEAEANQVRRWIQAHPENEQYFVQLYEAWHQALPSGTDAIDTDKAYADFITERFPAPVKANKKIFKASVAFAGVAAVAIALWLFYPTNVQPDNTIKLSAARGAKRMYKLQDGTIIWLNAGSRLDISPDFNIKNRTVYLSGEAFFEIGPVKKGLPFLVKTKKFSIRDIGTKFNVKAYPEENLFEASVMQGEVSVENGELKGMGNNRIYLKEHQVLRISANDLKAPSAIQKVQNTDFEKIQVLQISPAQQINYSGWKDNVLAFDSNSLREIATVLERHYNVSIVIADERLRDIRYSGTFKNVATIDDVLGIIEENTEINYTKAGNTITITGRKNI
ncbi:FecR family protein [Mucilaginibacter conchicola]|uniref:FecR family protein n=1 Tax=Mucilaginibacter conchicola TaxID=2303333 RepID=A0A372NV18_9SPHI|nr:FecR domain-containing protein [Mucilaginibacter conchicola]RFZ94008.1 FecR family protein [Mucilaginibacter conchicola]